MTERDPVGRLVEAARAYRASDVYVEQDGRPVFIGTAMHADDWLRPHYDGEPFQTLTPLVSSFSVSMEATVEQTRRLARLLGIPLRLLGVREPTPWKHPGRRYPRRHR
jgi:hypothetical protein